MHDDTQPPYRGLTVAVLGATGNLGGHYAHQALEAGHTVRALARTVTKLTIADHPSVTPIQGDATNPGEVDKLIDGADVVVSCVGNPSRSHHIMEATANHVLAAAGRQPDPPRCLFISSIGVGGSSWLIGAILRIIGRDPAGFADYEAADHRIRTETTVPVALVRPYALTDKPGTGRYRASAKSPIHFAKPIARADVAAFLFDATTNPQWDGPHGIQVTGA